MKHPKPRRSGYKLERVYVTEQEYRVLDPASVSVTDKPRERDVSFGWDWRALGPRRFEVVIEVGVGPTAQSPERTSVRLFGVFSAGEGELSIPFHDFVRQNAPAILFPYAREVISTMTGRGPFGAFHIDPLNLKTIMGKVPLSETRGHALLAENQDMAAAFGLYTAEATPSTARG